MKINLSVWIKNWKFSGVYSISSANLFIETVTFYKAREIIEEIIILKLVNFNFNI